MENTVTYSRFYNPKRGVEISVPLIQKIRFITMQQILQMLLPFLL